MSYMDCLEYYFTDDNIPHTPQGDNEVGITQSSGREMLSDSRSRSNSPRRSRRRLPDDEKDDSESPRVKPISELEFRDLPKTLQIANKLDRTVLDSWRNNLGRLRDLRGSQWDYIRCHLENTFDVRLPPIPRMAWVAAQAAMGLKGMQFASRKTGFLPDPLDMVILGRIDCGMSLEFGNAKSLLCPLDGIYSPRGVEEPCDLARLFQHCISQLRFHKSTLTKNAGLPGNRLGWRPLFWPTGILQNILVPKVLELISVNLGILRKQKGDRVSILPMLQFISEIMWRCCYIIESYRAMSPGKRLGLNLLGASVQELTEIAREGRCYWPWLGPDVELDVFIFEHNIMKEREPFDVRTSYLVSMYGMGIRDLRFLQRNPNEGEKKTQLETLHRCHTLRAWLGEEESADLAEQLEFCYFSMAASKANKDPTRFFPPGLETHELRVKARQREFKILKIMVDRIWTEIDRTRGSRKTPILLRRRFNAARQLTREGDWHLLDPGHRCVLLGGPSRYHREHKEHAKILQQWPAPHFHYRDDNNDSLGLNQGIYVPPGPTLVSDPYALLPPRLFVPPPGSLLRGGNAMVHLTPSERLKVFTRDFEDRFYFAPKGLEKFIEIHDFAMLEKSQPDLFEGAIPAPGPDDNVEEDEEDLGEGYLPKSMQNTTDPFWL